MSRTARRVAIASLALGLGFTGTAAAMVEDRDPNLLAGFLGLQVVDGVVGDDLPAITGDVESGLAGLLGGDGDLLGGILGGTGGILDEVLGGLGAGLGNGLGTDLGAGLGETLGPFLGQDLAIQPVPTIGGGELLEDPRVGAGVLGGLLDIGSITGLLAGRF